MIEGSRNEKDKENKQLQVKLLELQEHSAKLMLEKDELTKALKNTRDRLDIEVRNREKAQIQLNNMQA